MADPMRKTQSEIPKDVVFVTRDEAIEMQTKLIYNWENSSDKRAFVFGPGILGSFSAITGMYINNHFRNKLHLGNFGRLSTYLPIAVLPAIMSTVYHKVFVQPDILLEDYKCTLCLQSRAGLMQCALGIAYPFLLAPISCYMFAVRHYTFRIPSITEKPMAVFKLYKKMLRPILHNCGLAIVVHWAVAMYITYKEIESYHIITSKVIEMEKEFVNKKNKMFD